MAECGGFLYLEQSLQDQDGQTFPMVGILPGHGLRTDKLVRFGYAELTARQGGLLFRQGKAPPCMNSTIGTARKTGNPLRQ